MRMPADKTLTYIKQTTEGSYLDKHNLNKANYVPYSLNKQLRCKRTGYYTLRDSNIIGIAR